VYVLGEQLAVLFPVVENVSFSWQRALKVKRILIGLGIKESRIQLSAAGETGDSKKSKIAELSRRVDLYLLEENL